MNNKKKDFFLENVKNVKPLKKKNKLPKQIKKTKKNISSFKIKITENKIDEKQNHENTKSQFFIEKGKTNKLLKKAKFQ